MTVTWQSVNGITYLLERGTNLAQLPPFTSVSAAIPGQANTTRYTDNAVGNGPFFYRVSVQP